MPLDISLDQIIEEAKDPDHPMHSYFDWDDREVAAHHRRLQAMRYWRMEESLSDPSLIERVISIPLIERGLFLIVRTRARIRRRGRSLRR